MDFSLQQCELFGGQEQDLPSGKTSPESSVTTKGEDLLRWLERWQGYTLTYRKVDGETPVFSSGQTPLSSGQFWMRNSSEFRSGAVASSLSEILETGPVDRRYFLSPKACKGILRRAANRGKSLPPSLREALEAVALDQTSTATGGVIEVCMSTGQGSAEIGIGIGTTLNCNHKSPIITTPLTQNPYADNESRDSLLVTHSLSADGFDASEDGTGRGTPLVPVAHIDVLPTMRNGADTPAGHNARSGETKDDYIVPVAFESRFARNGRGAPSEIVPPLKAQSGETGKGDAAPLTMQGMQVRRLTPRECERLQGVPDGYTLVERNGKPMADGPRYKMLGNGFAVPVVRWIGERLAKAVK